MCLNAPNSRRRRSSPPRRAASGHAWPRARRRRLRWRRRASAPAAPRRHRRRHRRRRRPRQRRKRSRNCQSWRVRRPQVPDLWEFELQVHSWDMRFPPGAIQSKLGAKSSSSTCVALPSSSAIPGHEEELRNAVAKKAAQRPPTCRSGRTKRSAGTATGPRQPARSARRRPAAATWRSGRARHCRVDEPPTYWRGKYLDLEVQLTAVGGRPKAGLIRARCSAASSTGGRMDELCVRARQRMIKDYERTSATKSQIGVRRWRWRYVRSR